MGWQSLKPRCRGGDSRVEEFAIFVEAQRALDGADLQRAFDGSTELIGEEGLDQNCRSRVGRQMVTGAVILQPDLGADFGGRGRLSRQTQGQGLADQGGIADARPGMAALGHVAFLAGRAYVVAMGFARRRGCRESRKATRGLAFGGHFARGQLGKGIFQPGRDLVADRVEARCGRARGGGDGELMAGSASVPV